MNDDSPFRLKSFFGQLPERLKAAMEAAGQPREYQANDVLQRRGDMDQGFSIIEKGAVRFTRVNRDGTLIPLATLHHGDAWGEFTIFADLPRVYDAAAVEPTRIRFIDRETLLKLMDNDPDLRDHFLRNLTRQLHRTTQLVDELRTMRLDMRLARVLSRHARDHGRVMVTTQERLAEDLGVTRVGLAKALNRLVKTNLVETGYGKIIIHDAQGLIDYWRDSHQ